MKVTVLQSDACNKKQRLLQNICLFSLVFYIIRLVYESKFHGPGTFAPGRKDPGFLLQYL